MSEIHYIYFKAKPELMIQVNAINERVKAFSADALKLARSEGAIAAVMDQTSMVGFHFPMGPPDDTWRKVEGTGNGQKFFRPMVSRGHRELDAKMRALRKPTWASVLALVDLYSHHVLGTHQRGRGFPAHYAEGEYLGEDLVFKVPIGKGTAQMIGDASYTGHVLLEPLTLSQYYSMKAVEAAKGESDAELSSPPSV